MCTLSVGLGDLFKIFITIVVFISVDINIYTVYNSVNQAVISVALKDSLKLTL